MKRVGRVYDDDLVGWKGWIVRKSEGKEVYRKGYYFGRNENYAGVNE